MLGTLKKDDKASARNLDSINPNSVIKQSTARHVGDSFESGSPQKAQNLKYRLTGSMSKDVKHSNVSFGTVMDSLNLTID